MQAGDFAKYRNTGTVGKVLEVAERGGRRWALLDTYDLYYDCTALEPATESEYKVKVQQAKSLEEQVEEVERLREQIMEAEKSIGRISPSGT
jgi:hypothetical protein